MRINTKYMSCNHTSGIVRWETDLGDGGEELHTEVKSVRTNGHLGMPSGGSNNGTNEFQCNVFPIDTMPDQRDMGRTRDTKAKAGLCNHCQGDRSVGYPLAVVALFPRPRP